MTDPAGNSPTPTESSSPATPPETAPTATEIDTVAPVTAAAQPVIELHKRQGYSAVTYSSGISTEAWAQIESAAGTCSRKLGESGEHRLLIDLSQIEYLQSAGIASLLRIWKSMDPEKRLVVVVADAPQVLESLQIAGLKKLLTIVATREEAAYLLGVSQGAQVEQRERRVLAWVALPTAIIAALALFPMYWHDNPNVRDHSELGAALLSIISAATAVLCLVRDSGIRRWLSLPALLLSLAVVACLYTHRFQPDLFGKSPAAEEKDDDSEEVVSDTGDPQDDVTSDSETDGASPEQDGGNNVPAAAEASAGEAGEPAGGTADRSDNLPKPPTAASTGEASAKSVDVPPEEDAPVGENAAPPESGASDETTPENTEGAESATGEAAGGDDTLPGDPIGVDPGDTNSGESTSADGAADGGN